MMTTGWETIMMWIIAPVVAAVAGGWGGCIFGRKRQKIDDINAATDTFNKIIEQLRKEIGVYMEERERNGELIKELKRKYPQATIHGHREFANKACPCFDSGTEYGIL